MKYPVRQSSWLTLAAKRRADKSWHRVGPTPSNQDGRLTWQGSLTVPEVARDSTEVLTGRLSFTWLMFWVLVCVHLAMTAQYRGTQQRTWLPGFRESPYLSQKRKWGPHTVADALFQNEPFSVQFLERWGARLLHLLIMTIPLVLLQSLLETRCDTGVAAFSSWLVMGMLDASAGAQMFVSVWSHVGALLSGFVVGAVRLTAKESTYLWRGVPVSLVAITAVAMSLVCGALTRFFTTPDAEHWGPHSCLKLPAGI